jgi:hypothetical protein
MQRQFMTEQNNDSEEKSKFLRIEKMKKIQLKRNFDQVKN